MLIIPGRFLLLNKNSICISIFDNCVTDKKHIRIILRETSFVSCEVWYVISIYVWYHGFKKCKICCRLLITNKFTMYYTINLKRNIYCIDQTYHLRGDNISCHYGFIGILLSNFSHSLNKCLWIATNIKIKSIFCLNFIILLFISSLRNINAYKGNWRYFVTNYA